MKSVVCNQPKDQRNEAIEYETNFDSKFSLSSGTNHPLTTVTFSLQGGNKHRVTIIYGLTCLWNSGDTYIVIKR